MRFLFKFTKSVFVVFFVCLHTLLFAQGSAIKWANEGNQYYTIEKNELIKYSLPSNQKETIISNALLLPQGKTEPLKLRHYIFSTDESKVLIYTNTQKVWRLNTRGDYWLLNKNTKSLTQLGKSLPPSSMMFAKFSPDGKKVAYVSNYNLYIEDLSTNKIKALTTNGNRKLINGTFDWAYEEEFACRDGFQWSPDSKKISYWNSDANQIKDFYMINNTDSIYSKVIPVEYPKIGYPPSPVKIGIADISKAKTTWMKIPGNPSQHYLPRMEWINENEILAQQLNRHQNESMIYICNVKNGEASVIFQEKDKSWIDVYTPWENVYTIDFRHKFSFINNNKEFLWMSEKDGWRHLYRMTIDKAGAKEVCITNGAYDVMDIRSIDEKKNIVYFLASPDNATQKYLYKTKLDGTGKPERVSPADQEGTHNYNISPNGKYARHIFSNVSTEPLREMLDLSTNRALDEEKSIKNSLAKIKSNEKKEVEFFKIKTTDNIEMDGWMVKPNNFDPTKKYPVVFYVYTEPWGANVHDEYGAGSNGLYKGSMKEDGYIYISIDNRGTPAPKGREWRKSIYRKVGRLNISDQAMAAKEILQWPFVDKDRIAVWGWSGGGSATLNLMFQYPDIYKTGIAIAAVANQLTYDNIYQERYMGLPVESMSDIVAGSPITHAKNLKGNLLYIHGTADDNVHYANAEMLINELIKHNKQFQFMAYPNRSHSISEGEGTNEHLSTLYTEYLKKHCPPGGR